MPESLNDLKSLENQPYNPSVSAPAGTAYDFSWWGLLGMVILFLIILLVALFMIRKLNRYTVRDLQSPWLRVLDRQILNGQQMLYLVEIAGRIQVIAGTDHHLTKVAEIDDAEIAAEILEEIANRPEERMDKFLNGISRKIRGRKRRDPFSSELERLLEEVEK